MATVRISHELLYAVRHKIDTACNIETEALIKKDFDGESANVFSSPEAQLVAEKVVWGDNLHLKDTLPQEWLTQAMSVQVVVVRFGKQNTRINLQSPAGPLLLPPKFNPYDLPRVKEGTSAFYTLSPFIEICDRRCDEIAKINEKFNRLKEQVITFLKSCKSLNDAVAKFPDIMLWVPSEYKARLEEKVERKQRSTESAAVPPEIDKDFIVTTGVINAITRS